MNLRPPRPERGALPGCATLRHVPVGWRSYRLAICGRQAPSRNFFSCIHMLQYGTLCPDRETGGAERLRARERLVDNAQAGSRPRLAAASALRRAGARIMVRRAGTQLGRRQVVRQRFLVPPFAGSNPAAPARSAAYGAAPPGSGGTGGITLGPIPQAADHAFWLWSFLTSASARSAAGRVTSGAQ